MGCLIDLERHINCGIGSWDARIEIGSTLTAMNLVIIGYCTFSVISGLLILKASKMVV